MASKNSKTQETRAHFRARVKEMTGVAYRAIPISSDPSSDMLGGQVICRRSNVCVVTFGYPDREDADGVEIWDPKPENFRRVIL